MICPICKARRPEEMHLDWCTHEGVEPDDEVFDDEEYER